MIIPGFGMISQIVGTFSKKPVFGYLGMAYAMVMIAGIGFVVWDHHMFVVGLSMTVQAYFMVLSKLHFWVTLIGVNVVFFPQHFLGLAGMPRRYADYPEAFAGWNFVSSVGSYISEFGLLVFLLCMAHALMRKERAPASPWGAGATTLEWTLSSPPPFHQFEPLPLIR